MSSEKNQAGEFLFHRKEMDESLLALAKECRKRNRNQPEFEIILVGGSSIVLNYNFRESTTDLDAILRGPRDTFKEAIENISDQKGYRLDWINDDFKKTTSYSDKLIEHSKFYKRFANCLNVRTVNAEYLLAMKIQSAREYKHDFSDIVGILKEHSEMGTPITFEKVLTAYKTLYNKELDLPKDLDEQIKSIFYSENYEDLYEKIMRFEAKNKEAMKIVISEYSDLVNSQNIRQFIQGMRRKMDKQENPLVNDHSDENNIDEMGFFK